MRAYSSAFTFLLASLALTLFSSACAEGDATTASPPDPKSSFAGNHNSPDSGLESSAEAESDTLIATEDASPNEDSNSTDTGVALQEGGNDDDDADSGVEQTDSADTGSTLGDAADSGDSTPCLKVCAGQCVSPEDPAFGCNTSSCDPIDVQTTPLHCGVCGHSCQGGPCVDGFCVPQVIASAQEVPHDVAVDDTAVYWTTQGSDTQGKGTASVWRVLKTGGTPAALASAQNNADFLAVHKGFVYWSNNNMDCTTNGSVMRVAVTGGTPETIKAGLRCPQDIAVDDSGVYWVTYTSGEVWRANVDGSAPTLLLSKPDNRSPLFGIAIDADSIYFTHASDQGAVMKTPKNGGPFTTLAQNQQRPEGVAVDSSGLYWVTTFAGAVMRMPPGGSAYPLVSAGQSGATLLALDANSVFLSKRFVTAWGSVARINKLSKTLVELTEPQGDPRGIAVDDQFVYWVDQKQSLVQKVAK